MRSAVSSQSLTLLVVMCITPIATRSLYPICYCGSPPFHDDSCELSPKLDDDGEDADDDDDDGAAHFKVIGTVQ